MWVYPRKPKGRFHTARLGVSVVLLAVLFAGPFIRIHGNPFFLVNIVERKFSVLGQMFWPQDGMILALGLLIFITGIIVFTAAFGRLWCGWACPQTVLMEMVFRKIEYWIEGDAVEQRALAAAPWGMGKTLKKVSKHAVFFALSFVIGNTLLAYIVGSDQLLRIITDDPRQHLEGLAFMMLFTVIFYAIFARFREQACTFICPYGRFQSALLDENTIVVAYDHKRGEQRGHLQRGVSLDQRRAQGQGACVDCHACVVVCPTGIDIRNGTQMECVNCTACIDACDTVMDKTGQPRGLIRYASLNGIERGERLRVTPRLVGYAAILLLLGCVMAAVLLTRSDVDGTLLRAPGALFQKMPDGKISNLYQLKLVNKTTRALPVELRLENIAGKLTVLGGNRVVPAQQLAQTSVLVEVAPELLAPGTTRLVIGLYSDGRRLDTLKTVFVGPRGRVPGS
jgi:cytochrome c oxidase accessory protein FixG